MNMYSTYVDVHTYVYTYNVCVCVCMYSFKRFTNWVEVDFGTKQRGILGVYVYGTRILYSQKHDKRMLIFFNTNTSM